MANSRFSAPQPYNLPNAKAVAASMADRGPAFVLSDAEFAAFMRAVHSDGPNSHVLDALRATRDAS